MPFARHVGLGLSASLLLFATGAAAAGSGQSRGGPKVSADGLLRVDAAYVDVAARTGGEIFALGPGETFPDPARVTRGAGWKPVALRHGELTPAGGTEVAAEIAPGVARLRFYLFVQKKIAVEIRRPDGRVLAATDPGVEWNEPRFMLFATVSDPEPGVWTFAFSGQGRWLASVRTGKETVRIPDLELEFLQAAVGHGPVLLALDRIPAPGADAICRVVFFHDVESPTFELETADGSGLGTLALASVPSHRLDGTTEPSREFLGGCRVPPGPFRLVVRGTDRGGAYRRATDVLFPGAIQKKR